MAKTPEILSLAPTQQILTSGSGTSNMNLNVW